MDEFKSIHETYVADVKKWIEENPDKNAFLTVPNMEIQLFYDILRENPSLFSSKEFQDYILQSRPECFFSKDAKIEFELGYVYPLFAGTDVKGLIPDVCRYLDGIKKIDQGKLIEKPVIYDENLSKLYDKVTAQSIENIKKLQAEKPVNVHFQDEIGDIEPADLLKMILEKYKGKTILIDMWETWCTPCRMGHKEMAPLKAEDEYKDIVYIYFSSPSSPLDEWVKYIIGIPGEHYHLNNIQKSFFASLYESDGVPTYAIYNAKGEKVQSFVGWRGLDFMKNALKEAMK